MNIESLFYFNYSEIQNSFVFTKNVILVSLFRPRMSLAPQNPENLEIP